MSLNEDQIAELLVPFLQGLNLSVPQLSAFRAYLDLLLRWNSKINLTAIRDPEEIVTRHFGESLFAAQILFPKPVAQSVIDVGSGAGFPGIPIKLWNDDVELTLVESHQKKSVFLGEVLRALGIVRASVQTTRAEQLRTTADLVSLRAVERLEQILPAARRLLGPNGRLALLIGAAQTQAVKDSLPELVWTDAVGIPQSTNRVLLVGQAG